MKFILNLIPNIIISAVVSILLCFTFFYYVMENYLACPECAKLKIVANESSQDRINRLEEVRIFREENKIEETGFWFGNQQLLKTKDGYILK